MKISIVWDLDKLFKLNKSVSTSVQLSLRDVWDIIRNSAIRNAPVWKRENYPDTPSNRKRRWWTLRKSISIDMNKVQQWIVVVWSPVAYSRIREYLNYLQPQTKYYLKRWYTENKRQIMKIIATNLSKEL